MAKKVSDSRKMSAVNQFRRTKDNGFAFPKLRKQNVIEYKDLPTDGGNGLDGYVLNVMKLE